MSNLLSLLRQTLRALSRARGYALAACLTLAVGLAAALGAFAPAWDLLAFPFDFKEPNRIVSLSGEGPGGADFLRPLSAMDFWDLRGDLKAVQSLGACKDAAPELEFPDGPRQMRTGLISSGFFQVMGMPLLMGRDFEAQEAEEGGAKVTILEHGFWVSHFGSDPQILGKTLALDGVPHQIVGVLAPQKRLPFFFDDAIAFQPLVFRGGDRRRDVSSCWVFGRLAGGASLRDLQMELDQLAPRLGPPRSSTDRSWGIKARGLVAYFRARVAPNLMLSMASGLLILILACANVAHLMLARNLGRTREWGLRAALGADRGGLKAPLLMEASLLILGGVCLALPLLKGLQLLRVLGDQAFGASVWIPLVITLIVALLSTALLPLRWAGRLDLNEALRECGGASASRGSNRIRGTLTVVQLALAFALLVGAGLSFRALERLQNLSPGYDLKNLHAAMVRLEGRTGENFKARSAAFQRHVRQALTQVPGVTGVAMSNTRPLMDQGNGEDLWPEAQGAIHAGQHGVSPEYFRTLRIPLLAGRILEEGEREGCLISASLARQCWGEGSPLGKRIRLYSAQGPLVEVVGVVGEARMARLAREAVPAVYTSLESAGSGFLTVYVRSAASASALKPLIGEAARRADGAAKLLEFQSLESLAARELKGPRAMRIQSVGVAILAAFLAGIGLTGTLAQVAARQKREWGIRMALGASPKALFNLIFRRVLRLLAMGLALGAVFAWALGRLLQHQLQGVSPADPGLVAFAMLSLGLTGFLAGLSPALRAARVNPAEALRSE